MTSYERVVLFWQQKNIHSDAELSEVLSEHSIAFAYHSGKIENDKVTYFDTREIFNHDGVTSYTGDLRTLYEIRNSKNANELFLNSFGHKSVIDEELVLQVHKELTNSTYDTRRWQLGERPGEYKQHDYVTGKQEIGASPKDVKAEMDELLAELIDVKNENALTAAAYFHVKFENIHPFADGNGRCGRLLMNYFLVLHNHPPIIIHEEDRINYYKALESWDTKQKLNPMVEFLKSQTVKTWERQVNRLKEGFSNNKVFLDDFII